MLSVLFDSLIVTLICWLPFIENREVNIIAKLTVSFGTEKIIVKLQFNTILESVTLLRDFLFPLPNHRYFQSSIKSQWHGANTRSRFVNVGTSNIFGDWTDLDSQTKVWAQYAPDVLPSPPPLPVFGIRFGTARETPNSNRYVPLGTSYCFIWIEELGYKVWCKIQYLRYKFSWSGSI